MISTLLTEGILTRTNMFKFLIINQINFIFSYLSIINMRSYEVTKLYQLCGMKGV